MGSRVFLTFEWLCGFICGGRRASQLLFAWTHKATSTTSISNNTDTGWSYNFLNSESTLHRPTRFHRRPRQARTCCRRPAASRELRAARQVPGTRLGPTGSGLLDTAAAFQHALVTSSPAVITFQGQGPVPQLHSGWPGHPAFDWSEGLAHVIGL